MDSVNELKNRFPCVGRLEWIGLSRKRRGKVEAVQQAVLKPGTGIEGEHHAQSGHSDRQVTLIQHEHLAVVAALLDRNEVSPELLRRNLAVSGVNVLALKDKQFRIGEALLEGTGPCAPCSRMEENLGPGGYTAMLGHGGITAKVLEGGTLHIGDAVQIVNRPD